MTLSFGALQTLATLVGKDSPIRVPIAALDHILELRTWVGAALDDLDSQPREPVRVGGPA
jgi:hypothetical protein